MIVLIDENILGYYKVVPDKKKGDYSDVEHCNAGYTGHGSKLIHSREKLCKKVSPCSPADSKCPYSLGKFKQLCQNFTSRELALHMARKLFDGKTKEEIESDIVLDPCVGAGNLLMAALELGASEENLYGIDIDPDMIAFCMKRWPKGHFQVGNALEDDMRDEAFWTKEPLSKYTPTSPKRDYWEALTSKGRNNGQHNQFALR
jgi:hypothetical protein